MSKMEPPPDYHTGYSHHPPPPGGHHPHPPGGHHPHPPGGYNPHPPGGYHPSYAPSSNNNQNQGINNTFAPVLNQPQTQSTNVVVNTGDLCGGVGARAGNDRDWSTQLFGCFEDFGGCVCGIFVPTCMAMGISSRMNELFCLPLLVPQWMLALRVKLRAANKIRGGIFTDCMATTCCPLCVICQLKRELDNIDRRKPAGGL